MATEVGLIALDVLGLYSLHLKEQLLYKDGDNPLMKKIFDIYLSFLQVGQSEKMFKHLFAALRAFINKVFNFPFLYFRFCIYIDYFHTYIYILIFLCSFQLPYFKEMLVCVENYALK